jgi:hypothetical protein
MQASALPNSKIHAELSARLSIEIPTQFAEPALVYLALVYLTEID